MSILRQFNKHHGYTFEGKRTPFGGGGKGGGSAPPPPDYTGAAKETAQGNLDAARTAAAANRVNQVTPYGNLTYSVNPSSQYDPYGNPTWTATTTLSPEQQQLLDIQNKTSIGMGNLQNQGLNYVQDMISKPFDTSKLAQTGINPSENYSDAIMRRLQPQLQMESKSFDQKMANSGIPVGSEAYMNAKRQFDMTQNDRLVAAQTGGIDVGLRANQQGFGQLGYIRNEPINTLNAIRSGSQVTNPTFQSVPQQATTQGADILGATQAGYNAQLGASNASNASSAANTGGMYQLGGTALMAGAMMM
jgi:hypothetical protein